MNLNMTSQNIYSTLMCGLRIFAGTIYTIYRVTSYLRLLALSILTCSPNICFLAGLVSDNSKSLEKNELGHCPPQPPKEKIVHWVWVPSSYLRVRFVAVFDSFAGCRLWLIKIQINSALLVTYIIENWWSLIKFVEEFRQEVVKYTMHVSNLIGMSPHNFHTSTIKVTRPHKGHQHVQYTDWWKYIRILKSQGRPHISRRPSETCILYILIMERHCIV